MDTEDGSMSDVENEKLAPFFRPFYVELLESLSFINSPEAADTPTEPWDLEVTRTILKIIDSSISQDALPSYDVLNLSRFATNVCREHPPKAQLAVAQYVVLSVIIDSRAAEKEEKFTRDLELFQVKMCSPDRYSRLFPGRGPLHPVLENMITFLTTDLCPFFLRHPILHTLFIKSTMDFIAACQLEELHKGRLGSKLELSIEMQQYPAFLRVKSGVSEAFSLLVLSPLADEEDSDLFYNKIFPVLADLDDFWVNINDLLSLYKDIKEGDSSNYLLQDAKVNSTTLHDSIRKVVTHSVEGHKRIMSVVDNSGSPKFKKYMVQMYQGFLLWHVKFANRYHLDEVLSEWFAGVYWT